MVEMTETAVILNSATRDSLVILDEIGRGTATYDGLALAWAVVEYLATQIGAKALFATHYHELTALGRSLAGVRNLRVAVREAQNGIVFLFKVEPGEANRSYGIEVAKLAGLPTEVIERARTVLKAHERGEQPRAPSEPEAGVQLTIFTPLSQRIVDQIAACDLDRLSPLEALNLLADLKQQVKQ
jgi:DNA mismatch repair protein MutS